MSGKRNVSVCRGHELANALYMVWRLYIIDKNRPPTACNRSEAARRYYAPTGNGSLS